MLAAFLLVAAIVTAIAPSIGDQFGELRPRAEDGLRQATDVLAEPPFNLSETEIQDRVDEAHREAAREQRAARPRAVQRRRHPRRGPHRACSSRCC